MDLGPPVSYLVLEKGTAVFSSDQEQIGEVAHVLADEGEDVFDGVVIQEHGRHGHRFVDADQIAEMHRDGVLLKLDSAAAAELPEPSANPAVIRDDPADPGSSPLAGKLRRAWDYISGKY